MNVEAVVQEFEQLISHSSDQEVLELADLQMSAQENRQMSRLLQKQGRTKLTAKEHKELWALVDVSRYLTLKKAFALREVSRRGLQEQCSVFQQSRLQG